MNPPPFHRSVTITMMLILFISGFCSLVYQTVWIREFRLLFGGAAPAAAAVLAVFMGGLGLGGKLFGNWVERVGRPCRFYARIEIGISIAAALSPALLGLARSLYLPTGGAASLGSGTATIVQLLITALVLGLPCFLMGGSLPAAMKFLQTDEDSRRSTTALFYALNVAGAVAGAAIGTFYLLPTYGNQGTLILSALINGLIALGAGFISNRLEIEPRPTPSPQPSSSTPSSVTSHKAPISFILAAAFLSGFTFFVIELLWYRLSTPLLGGSVYGFGLVLCVALAGIGLGGFIYAMVLKKVEPGLRTFTLVSALQAATILIPYALGDRVAYLALLLNENLRGFGFTHMVSGWTLIMSLIAFLPSLLSGVQFPLLVSLLGSGNQGVGRQLGQAYLWNTAGAISGSLLGGFILMPSLGSTKCLVVMALVVLAMSILSFAIDFSRNRHDASFGARPLRFATVIAMIVCVLFAVIPQGPTSAWLHQPIGYGRVSSVPKDSLTFESWVRSARRQHLESYDGRETSVALVAVNDFAFLTNGKSDGSAVGDAATQVMLGLTGAALHPSPTHACVVGLGTGTTAGWLADVPGIERVDVLELEPEIEKLARHFDPVSRNAMQHPRVNRITGDAREFLLTRGANYDLIVSEPSNPCRAGVANIYNIEFDQQACKRLQPNGLFCQWLQGYEVSPDTIKTVIATLGRVFKKVEVWSTQSCDMLLVCSAEDTPWSLASLRQRIQLPPISEAIQRFWLTDSAEGFLASCMANSQFCRNLASTQSLINTDDRNILEFNFARSLGSQSNPPELLTEAACKADMVIPNLTDGQPDLSLYSEERLQAILRLGSTLSQNLIPKVAIHPGTPDRIKTLSLVPEKRWQDYLNAASTTSHPTTLAGRLQLARVQALAGHPDALLSLEPLTSIFPNDINLLKGIWYNEKDDLSSSAQHFASAFSRMRTLPWTTPELADYAFQIVQSHAKEYSPEARASLFQNLQQPFSVHLADYTRLATLASLAGTLGPKEQQFTVAALGPHFPWDGKTLALRAKSFLDSQDPRLAQAMVDIEQFFSQGGTMVGTPHPFHVSIPKTVSEAQPKPPTE